MITTNYSFDKAHAEAAIIINNEIKYHVLKTIQELHIQAAEVKVIYGLFMLSTVRQDLQSVARCMNTSLRVLTLDF